MDGSRFDRITQTLAAGQTRRRALAGIVGGALGGVLGLARVEETAAACVKPNKKGCKGPKNGKCCPGSVCKGGTKDKPGKCQCKGGTKQCGTKCVNTKTDKNNCGGCGRTCQGQNSCKNGVCTSKLGCKQGENVCDNPQVTVDDLCGGDGGPSFSCICITDLDGVTRCSNFAAGFCSTCISNADCGPGFVCFDASGPGCECDLDPGSNGNACTPVDCGGVSGSRSRGGRARLRAPLFR